MTARSSLKKRAELRVGRRPVAARMRSDALVEMTKLLPEGKMLEELMHFIVHRWQSKFIGQRGA